MSLGQVSLVAILLLNLATPVFARTADQGRTMPKIQQGAASGIAPWESRNRQVFGVATAGTTFYGGTFWAADSQRWEAYENQLWTFDTGVGSSIVPVGGPGQLSAPTSNWVNPFKQPGHHATMEGWIGFDRTLASSYPSYFRRLSANDSRWQGNVCVGAQAGLQGNYSYWAGVFSGEANALCYKSGQGYGNSWNICIEHAFAYSGNNVSLSFQYKSETDDCCDGTYVYSDTGGTGDPSYIDWVAGAGSGTLLNTFWPNPFRAGETGHLPFSMAQDSPARIQILDLQGRLVRSVFDGPAKKGMNEVAWDGRDAYGASVASGVYFYRFKALEQEETKKLIVLGGGK